MKKILLIIITILCIIPIKTNAIQIEKNNYVIENNTIIKKEVKDYINLYSEHLKKYADIRFYVLISNEDLEEEEINKIEEEVYTKHKGLILIGFKGTGTIKLRIGSDISRLFTQTELNKVLEEYALKDIEKSNWNQAIKNTYIVLYQKISNTYYVPVKEMEIDVGNPIEENKLLITFIFIGIGIIISINICSFFKKRKKKRNSLDYLLLIISVILNFILMYTIIKYVSVIAIIPIIIGELTTTLLYYKEPGRIENNKKKKRKRRN